MNKFQKVVASAVAAAGLLMNVALPVLAQTTIEISGNGADSKNTADVKISQTTSVMQTNNADIDNKVTVNASTGENKAEKNTGGSVSIETGDATVGVTVANTANSNQADVACCGVGDIDVLISGNGAGKTDNKVDLNIKQATTLWQINNADIYNDVDASAKTGKNEAEKNTGGNVSIETGDATVGVAVSTTANANSATIGGSGTGGTLSAWIVGNGADSKNEIKLKLGHDLVVGQTNDADIDNDVDASAKTGENKAKKNTGGTVSIETGDAEVDVTVDNMANFNWADVDCGGCLLGDLFAKIAGNGADSKNKIKAELGDKLEIFQTNLATSGELDNDVVVEAKTGKNEVKESTGDPGGDPAVESGDATITVGVDNSVNFNSYGSEAPSWFPVIQLPTGGEIHFGFNWAFFWAWLGLFA